jgi:hypothetical protein
MTGVASRLRLTGQTKRFDTDVSDRKSSGPSQTNEAEGTQFVNRQQTGDLCVSTRRRCVGESSRTSPFLEQTPPIASYSTRIANPFMHAFKEAFQRRHDSVFQQLSNRSRRKGETIYSYSGGLFLCGCDNATDVSDRRHILKSSLDSVWYVLGDMPEALQILAAVTDRGTNSLYRLVYNFPH